MRNLKKFALFALAIVCILSVGLSASAKNPYMALWEHVPDGEPYVFEDPDHPGEYRVYVYGSHDVFESRMCGPNYVVWSAPVDDLTNWEYEGISFDGGESGYLLAPDVCEGLDGRYYLYAFGDCDQGGKGQTFMAVSDRPDGPFEYVGPVLLDGSPKMLFDPAVLVDDDGSVYLFGGSAEIYQLDPADMRTIIKTVGQVQEQDEDGNLSQIRYFLEGSSIRKIDDFYVFVYAAQHPLDETWVSNVSYTANRYTGTLEYAYSKTIEGPYTYGGIVVDNGGEKLGDGAAESMLKSNYNGNTHGGICLIEDQWYVFYHRQTNDTQTYRQAMCDPIALTVTEDSVQIQQAEMTSQGVQVDGLPAEQTYSAGIACYLTNSAYIHTDVEMYDTITPVVNIKVGAAVGYKYINFDGKNYDLSIDVKPMGPAGYVTVTLDDPANAPIATFAVPEGASDTYTTLTQSCGEISGKHAVYFNFYAYSQQEICEFASFAFSQS